LTDPIQQEIAEEFSFFGDWSERYQYSDRPRPQAAPVPGRLAHRSEPPAWLPVDGVGGVGRRCRSKLVFHAISDSSIVAGLIALTLRVYSGRSASRDPGDRTAASSKPSDSASTCR
jgi:cysteine desulfuration protein SufE